MPILGRVLVLLLAWPALAAVAGETVLQEEPVRIATSSEAAIFPVSWRGGVVQASGTALPEADHERVRTLLSRALAK